MSARAWRRPERRSLPGATRPRRWRAFQRSRPASASSLFAARLISSSGFFDTRRPVLAGFGALFRLRRLDPGRLAGLLFVVRRPGRVAQALGLLPSREVEKRLERTRAPIDGRVAIADRGEARRHGAQRVLLRPALEELVPGHRRRNPPIGLGSHRVGAGDGSVLGVLVVVEENAVPLLLPPLARGELEERFARPRGRRRGPHAEPARTTSADGGAR